MLAEVVEEDEEVVPAAAAAAYFWLAAACRYASETARKRMREEVKTTCVIIRCACEKSSELIHRARSGTVNGGE